MLPAACAANIAIQSNKDRSSAGKLSRILFAMELEGRRASANLAEAIADTLQGDGLI